MNIDTDSIVNLLIWWGIPAFMVIREYLKMDAEEKVSAMNEIKSPGFIFTLGFLVLGSFFTHLGILIGIFGVKVFGIVLAILGGTTLTLTMWKENKFKSILVFVLISFFVFLNVT